MTLDHDLQVEPVDSLDMDDWEEAFSDCLVVRNRNDNRLAGRHSHPKSRRDNALGQLMEIASMAKGDPASLFGSGNESLDWASGDGNDVASSMAWGRGSGMDAASGKDDQTVVDQRRIVGFGKEDFDSEDEAVENWDGAEDGEEEEEEAVGNANAKAKSGPLPVSTTKDESKSKAEAKSDTLRRQEQEREGRRIPSHVLHHGHLEKKSTILGVFRKHYAALLSDRVLSFKNERDFDRYCAGDKNVRAKHIFCTEIKAVRAVPDGASGNFTAFEISVDGDGGAPRWVLRAAGVEDMMDWVTRIRDRIPVRTKKRVVKREGRGEGATFVGEVGVEGDDDDDEGDEEEEEEEEEEDVSFTVEEDIAKQGKKVILPVVDKRRIVGFGNEDFESGEEEEAEEAEEKEGTVEEKQDSHLDRSAAEAKLLLPHADADPRRDLNLNQRKLPPYVIHHGKLEKKSSILGVFKPRYVALLGDRILSFKSRSECYKRLVAKDTSVRVKQILLPEISSVEIVREKGVRRLHAFVLNVGDRSAWALRAESPRDMMDWVGKMRELGLDGKVQRRGTGGEIEESIRGGGGGATGRREAGYEVSDAAAKGAVGDGRGDLDFGQHSARDEMLNESAATAFVDESRIVGFGAVDFNSDESEEEEEDEGEEEEEEEEREAEEEKDRSSSSEKKAKSNSKHDDKAPTMTPKPPAQPTKQIPRNILKHGKVQKKSTILGVFRDHYLALLGDRILSFKSRAKFERYVLQGDKSVKVKEILLPEVSSVEIVRDEGVRGFKAFVVNVGGKPAWALKTDAPEDMLDWVAAIEGITGRVVQRGFEGGVGGVISGRLGGMGGGDDRAQASISTAESGRSGPAPGSAPPVVDRNRIVGIGHDDFDSGSEESEVETVGQKQGSKVGQNSSLAAGGGQAPPTAIDRSRIVGMGHEDFYHDSDSSSPPTSIDDDEIVTALRETKVEQDVSKSHYQRRNFHVQGWAHKKGGVRRNWTRRYFAAPSHRELYYFGSSKDCASFSRGGEGAASPKGCIALDRIFSLNVDYMSKNRGGENSKTIVLETAARTWKICPETEETFRELVQFLHPLVLDNLVDLREEEGGVPESAPLPEPPTAGVGGDKTTPRRKASSTIADVVRAKKAGMDMLEKALPAHDFEDVEYIEVQEKKRADESETLHFVDVIGDESASSDFGSSDEEERAVNRSGPALVDGEEEREGIRYNSGFVRQNAAAGQEEALVERGHGRDAMRVRRQQANPRVLQTTLKSWVHKRGQSGLSNSWRRRLFVLDEDANAIVYFASENDYETWEKEGRGKKSGKRRARGRIDLRQDFTLTVGHRAEAPQRVLRMHTRRRTWEFAPESDADFVSWMQRLSGKAGRAESAGGGERVASRQERLTESEDRPLRPPQLPPSVQMHGEMELIVNGKRRRRKRYFALWAGKVLFWFDTAAECARYFGGGADGAEIPVPAGHVKLNPGSVEVDDGTGGIRLRDRKQGLAMELYPAPASSLREWARWIREALRGGGWRGARRSTRAVNRSSPGRSTRGSKGASPGRSYEGAALSPSRSVARETRHKGDNETIHSESIYARSQRGGEGRRRGHDDDSFGFDRSRIYGIGSSDFERQKMDRELGREEEPKWERGFSPFAPTSPSARSYHLARTRRETSRGNGRRRGADNSFGFDRSRIYGIGSDDFQEEGEAFDVHGEVNISSPVIGGRQQYRNPFIESPEMRENLLAAAASSAAAAAAAAASSARASQAAAERAYGYGRSQEYRERYGYGIQTENRRTTTLAAASTDLSATAVHASTSSYSTTLTSLSSGPMSDPVSALIMACSILVQRCMKSRENRQKVDELTAFSDARAGRGTNGAAAVQGSGTLGMPTAQDRLLVRVSVAAITERGGGRDNGFGAVGITTTPNTAHGNQGTTFAVPSATEIFHVLHAAVTMQTVPPQCAVLACIFVERYVKKSKMGILTAANYKAVTLCALMMAYGVFEDEGVGIGAGMSSSSLSLSLALALPSPPPTPLSNRHGLTSNLSTQHPPPLQTLASGRVPTPFEDIWIATVAGEDAEIEPGIQKRPARALARFAKTIRDHVAVTRATFRETGTTLREICDDHEWPILLPDFRAEDELRVARVGARLYGEGAIVVRQGEGKVQVATAQRSAAALRLVALLAKWRRRFSLAAALAAM